MLFNKFSEERALARLPLGELVRADALIEQVLFCSLLALSVSHSSQEANSQQRVEGSSDAGAGATCIRNQKVNKCRPSTIAASWPVAFASFVYFCCCFLVVVAKVTSGLLATPTSGQQPQHAWRPGAAPVPVPVPAHINHTHKLQRGEWQQPISYSQPRSHFVIMCEFWHSHHF